VSDTERRLRARELGITIGELPPGSLDAITDVDGVRVGHTTLIEGDSVRSGVTVVIPPELPCFAAPFRLNGNGEMTGLEWVRESGFLTSQIAITNTHSVGVVRDALVSAAVCAGDERWHLPVVAETWDGRLNDINGMHVRPEHVFAALETAAAGPVAEGSVGGGTGMVAHGFKGGIGTASRKAETGHTAGVLVQANHGRRARLQIDGVPVGRELGPERIPLPEDPGPAGSIIVIAATDAPLLPHQCARLAKRAALGIARTGGAGETSSGDLVLAFATGSRGLATTEPTTVELLPNERCDALFYAVIEATEEAIVNAMLAARTMTGRGGATVHALDPDLLVEVMRRHGRIRARPPEEPRPA
jgi:D-aminopeptidase